jgi:long-subunit fatty acid transport protein
MDIALGYSTRLASGLGLELAYWAYFLNDTGYATAEVIGTVSYNVTDKLGVSLEVGYDVEAEETYTELGFDYELTDKWSVQAVAAYETAADSNYYELGVTYAINDEVAFNVLYEDDDVTGNDGLLTFTMTYDFNISGN